MEFYEDDNMGEYFSKKFHLLYAYLVHLRIKGTITDEQFTMYVSRPLKSMFDEHFPNFLTEFDYPTKGTEIYVDRNDMMYRIHLN